MLHSRVMTIPGLAALLGLMASPAVAQQTCPATQGGNLPLKYAGGATVAAITPCDLMTRLYIYADDSLMGREVGSTYHLKATAYIESEVRRLGLRPGGDSGSYFQNIDVVARGLDTTSTISVSGATFRAGVDFLASSSGIPRTFGNAEIVYAGPLLDTTFVMTPEQARDKIIVFGPLRPGSNTPELQRTKRFADWVAMYLAAAGRVAVQAGEIPPTAAAASAKPRGLVLENREGQLVLQVTSRLGEAMVGGPLDAATAGPTGKTLTTDIRYIDEARPGRNVIAILPGSDPKLRGEYVAIGAHNDHIGFNNHPVDHDSLKVYNAVAKPQGADGAPARKLSDDEWKRVNVMIDSLHQLHGGARPDSIDNGADDDGSGTVSVLEMAEAFARGNVQPKRSILFIWHAGEERGMWGSAFFTDHPTVPRDSIVAEINIDMVGRGAPTDMTGETKDGTPVYGAAKYVQLVGSRRLSTELGDLAEAVNKGKDYDFKFDYSLDANGHPENIYCRSDHAMYAAWGIPVVFFTTGGHGDYHQVTDEPQYIRYTHMANLDHLIFDLAVRVADLDHRLVVDGKKMADPHGSCQQ